MKILSQHSQIKIFIHMTSTQCFEETGDTGSEGKIYRETVVNLTRIISLLYYTHREYDDTDNNCSELLNYLGI